MKKLILSVFILASLNVHANQVIVKNNLASSERNFDHADMVYINLSEDKLVSIEYCRTAMTSCQKVGGDHSLQEYQDSVERLDVEVGTDGFLVGGVAGSLPILMCLFARAKCAKFYSKIRNPVLKDVTIVSTVNGGLVGGVAGYGIDYSITHLTTEGEVVSKHQDLSQVLEFLERGLSTEIEVEDVRSFVTAISFMQLDIERSK